MIRFFLATYQFFERQKLLFYSLLFLLMLAIGYLASQVRFVEDLNSFMPKTEDSGYIGTVFKNSKVKDKIVLIVTGKDSLHRADPDQMIRVSDEFLDSLQHSVTGQSHIRSVMSRIDNQFIDQFFQYTMDHLPVFLDSTDYAQIDSLLIEKNMEKRMEQNYRNLISPLSLISKKIIFSDPLGIAGNSLKNLNNLQMNLKYDIYGDHIFSSDHQYLLAFISPTFSAGEISNNEQLVDEIENRIASFSTQYPEIKISYFGGIPISVYNARQIKSDSLLTMIITLSIITVVVLLAFRRKSAIPLIILPVIFGGVFSLAALFLIKGTISTIAVGAGSCILGVAFSYSIHVFCHSLHTKSAEQVIRELAYPMTIGSFTTIGAFAGLTFSSSDVLHDFGLFSCFTLIGTTLFCLLFLPHFLVFKPQKQNRFMAWIENINSYSFEKNKYLVLSIGLIILVSLFFFRDVRFNTDMMKLNFMPEQFGKAENILTNTFQDEYKSVYFISVGDNEEEALQNYRQADTKLKELKNKGLIREFSSAHNLLVPQNEQKQRIERWNRYWTTEKKETLKKNLLEAGNKYKFKETAFLPFLELVGKSHKPVDYNALNLEENRILEDWIDSTPELTMAVSQVRLLESDKEEVYDSFRNAGNMVILDKPYFANQLADTVNRDFNSILYIASILVFFSILISYGRIEITLITFLPMAISWLIILGLMAIFGIEFNIINIIISSFIFGIGDDFSIFITDGLLSEYKNGKKMLNEHKTAIFFSAFTVIVGLGAMVFSKHPALYSISITSIIGMFSVVLVSYTIQPLVFRLLISGRTQQGKFPHTLHSLFVTIIALGIFSIGSLLLAVLSYLFLLLPFPQKSKKAAFHQLLCSFSRFLLWIMANEKKVFENPSQENFEKPAIIISNHQSVIDILHMLALHPRLIMITKSWVVNSILFGRVARYAGFVNISNGYEQSEEWIRGRMNDGYSIVIFPEGSRSADCQIRRFHKGAFLLAEKLKADIVPVLLHGQGQVIAKNDPLYLKDGLLAVKILPRISYEKFSSLGNTYQDIGKKIAREFKQEHARFVNETMTNNPYYRYKLIKNYTYKGPVLEWYLRIKIAMEKDYQLFEKLIPSNAKITDIGCGYGFLAYFLAFKSANRIITGIDYDEEKIALANHNFSRNEQLKFITADISEIQPEPADVFVINDMLHYLPQEKQAKVLLACAAGLNPNGMIILRDGDREKKTKHVFTRISEFFSTKIMKFNKKKYELCFISSEEITTFALENGLSLSIMENDKYSSNVIYMMQKTN